MNWVEEGLWVWDLGGNTMDARLERLHKGQYMRLMLGTHKPVDERGTVACVPAA